MTKQTQNIVAVSETAKLFISDEAASYSAPSKSKDDMGATQREIADAMVAFTEKHRYGTVPQPVQVEETNEEGESIFVDHATETEEVEVDLFEVEVQKVLALRMDTVRTNTATAKLANAEKQLEELKAQLAALQGKA